MRREAAFTLAELLVVIAIIGILALCVMRASEGATARADVVRCMGNLRSLHMALVADVADQNHWPQCPYEVGQPGFDEWWIHELEKYKISPPNWICPTLDRSQGRLKSEGVDAQLKIHYVPTPFDAEPWTPRRWATQPWLVEIADNHGEGNLMVFPDGSIKGATRFLREHP